LLVLFLLCSFLFAFFLSSWAVKLISIQPLPLFL
jgi:hypothetical protein